jgi:Tfp pilus assembly protein PilO
MMRFLLPILLVAAAVVSFITWTNPILAEVQDLQLKAESYDVALENSRELREAKEELLSRSNAFNVGELEKLKKMLPNAVDNIGLIYEMEILASQYGIQLENAKFEPIAEDEDGNEEGEVSTRRPVGADNRLYDTFELEFSMQGSYSNFVAFLEKMEKSLRIVDIKSVTFNSTSTTENLSDVYRYNIVLAAYRLRN